MRRRIGVDLHTDSFTSCILLHDGNEETRTWRLQGGRPEKHVASLTRDEEVAVESTGNLLRFHDAIKPRVARVVAIAAGHFGVIGQVRQEDGQERCAPHRPASLPRTCCPMPG